MHCSFKNISDGFDNWHCCPIQNGRRWPFCQKKLRINSPEMRSKVIFRHPKCPPVAIFYKISKQTKMARNAIESKFRICKMVAEKKKNFRIDLKQPEMPLKVHFAHPKWPPMSILSRITNKRPLDLTAPPFTQVYAEHLSRTGKYVSIHMKS